MYDFIQRSEPHECGLQRLPSLTPKIFLCNIKVGGFRHDFATLQRLRRGFIAIFSTTELPLHRFYILAPALYMYQVSLPVSSGEIRQENIQMVVSDTVSFGSV